MKRYIYSGVAEELLLKFHGSCAHLLYLDFFVATSPSAFRYKQQDETTRSVMLIFRNLVHTQITPG